MQPVMREAPGEEVGQHWLVAHAAQILLMVVSTFIYTLCKRVIDEFANSVVLWVKDHINNFSSKKPTQPPSPTPPVDLVTPDTSSTPSPTPPVDSAASDPSSSAQPATAPSPTPPVDSATSDPSPSTQPATAPTPTPPVDSATSTPTAVTRPPSVVPRPAPPPSRDTLEFEKKGKSVTPTTLHRSLKYADLAHAPAGARWNPTPIKRAGATIVESGIEHLLASLQRQHVRQVRAVTRLSGGDLDQLREAIMTQYCASGGLARFIEACPAPLQSAFQRVLRLRKNARCDQIAAGIVLLGAHHYFRRFPNLLKKEWCRDVGLKVSGNAAELEERIMSHFFEEWEAHAQLRRSLVSRAHESYPVLSESESESELEQEEGESPGSESDDDQPLTWADKIEWALQQHGGEATLSEIYCATEVGFPEDIADKPNWQPAIRSCLSKNTRKGGRFAVEASPDGRKFSLSQG